jgi:hypothetical protein
MKYPTRTLNYGIAFALLGILFFSLFSSMEGFEESSRRKTSSLDSIKKGITDKIQSATKLN